MHIANFPRRKISRANQRARIARAAHPERALSATLKNTETTSPTDKSACMQASGIRLDRRGSWLHCTSPLFARTKRRSFSTSLQCAAHPCTPSAAHARAKLRRKRWGKTEVGVATMSYLPWPAKSASGRRKITPITYSDARRRQHEFHQRLAFQPNSARSGKPGSRTGFVDAAQVRPDRYAIANHFAV
jgi:hypothetical protein